MDYLSTADLGDENGGGVSRSGSGAPKQSFAGWMIYNRFWFSHDHNAITVGGGHAWDYSVTWDWMPNPFATWRMEFDHRAANVPYFSGPGGVIPPGGNQGLPGSPVTGWSPDLVKAETRINMALMVKF